MPVAAISAATSLGSAALSANAAGNAAKQQQQASAATTAANQALLSQTGQNVNPTIGIGNQSGNALAGLLGIGGNPAQSQQAFKDYLGSTNYNFLLNQGEQGQAFLSAPNLQSGATAKGLTNYAQGMAGNALQGYEGILQNEQGLGLQGSNIYANQGTQLAAQNAQVRNLAAGATGSAGLAGANAFGNALNGIGGSFGNALSSSSFGGGGFNPGQIGGPNEFINPSALQGITAPPITAG